MKFTEQIESMLKSRPDLLDIWKDMDTNSRDKVLTVLYGFMELPKEEQKAFADELRAYRAAHV